MTFADMEQCRNHLIQPHPPYLGSSLKSSWYQGMVWNSIHSAPLDYLIGLTIMLLHARIYFTVFRLSNLKDYREQ